MAKGRGWAYITRDKGNDSWVAVHTGARKRPMRDTRQFDGITTFLSDWPRSETYDVCYEDWLKVTGIPIKPGECRKVIFTDGGTVG